MTRADEPSFWRRYWGALWRSLGNLCVRYPLAAAATVLVVVGGVLLVAFGRSVRLGGMLGWLWGKRGSEGPSEPPVVVSGRPVQPGESDERGYVQAPARELRKPGLFSDSDAVTLTQPDGEEVKLPLPVGVMNRDVHEVVQISPAIREVANHDNGVEAGKLLRELKK